MRGGSSTWSGSLYPSTSPILSKHISYVLWPLPPRTTIAATNCLSAHSLYCRALPACTAVYLVDRVIPMLPRLLCEELCR